MTEEERQLTLRWIECWRRAGPELERIRAEEIRATRTARDLKAFEGLATASLKDCPPRPDSGLVEQQRWFSRLRQ